jgi:hypothetical protein
MYDDSASDDNSDVLTVYSCDKDDRPEYSNHWSLQKMGKVIFSFTSDEMRAGKSKMVNGRKIWRLDYDVQVDLFSDRGDLQFNSLLEGKKKNKAIIQFEQKFDMKGGD